MDKADFLFETLKPSSLWVQFQSVKAAVSPSHPFDEAISTPESRQQGTPSSLLDKWLDCQRAAVDPFRTGLNTKALTKHNMVLNKKTDSTTDKTLGFAQPAAELRPQEAPICAVESKHLLSSDAPSSVAGWKLQLFKAAMGIRRRQEEFDARRRRSLVALMKRAVHNTIFHVPADASGSEAAAPVLDGAVGYNDCFPCRKTPNSHRGSLHPGAAAGITTARRRSCAMAKKPSVTSGHGLQKAVFLVQRLQQLHREQLLASHRLLLLPKDLQVEALLGEGANGRVWRVKHPPSGQLFALKVIRKGAGSPRSSSCARAYAERHVLAHNGFSSGLVKLHAAFQDEQHLFLLQELLPGPSLFEVLQSRGPLAESEARRYAAELAAAVHAVHRLGFIHRDLKPENAVLDKHGRLKLIDLGLAAKPQQRKLSSSAETLPVCTAPTTRRRESSSFAAKALPSCPLAVQGGYAAVVAFSTEETDAAGLSRVTPIPVSKVDRPTDSFKYPCEAPWYESERAEDSFSSFSCKATRHSDRENIGIEPALLGSVAWCRLKQLSVNGARSCVGSLHYMAPEVAEEEKTSENFITPQSAFPAKDEIEVVKQALGGGENRTGVAFQGRSKARAFKEDSKVNLASVAKKRPRYSQKADWWSFGAVLYECLFGHPPFGRFRLVRDNQPTPGQQRCTTEKNGETHQLLQPGVVASRNFTPSQSAAPESPVSIGSSNQTGLQPQWGACVNNPELLISLLRGWRKHLQIPPFPFVVTGRQNPTGRIPDRTRSNPVVSEQAVDLLQNLLCEQDRRFGFARIKNHPWFSSVHWGTRAQFPQSYALKAKQRSDSTSRKQSCCVSKVASASASTLKHRFSLSDTVLRNRFLFFRNSCRVSLQKGSLRRAFKIEDCPQRLHCPKSTYLGNRGRSASSTDRLGLQRGRGTTNGPAPVGPQPVIQPVNSHSPARLPQCSSPSTLSDAELSSSGEDDVDLFTENWETEPAAAPAAAAESAADARKGPPAEGEEEVHNALCSCPTVKPDARRKNWLLDMRYVGYEFERRGVLARKAARKLRAVYEDVFADE